MIPIDDKSSVKSPVLKNARSGSRVIPVSPIKEAKSSDGNNNAKNEEESSLSKAKMKLSATALETTLTV